MYKVDTKLKKLEKLGSTGLREENILERKDLQQFIFNSWESFKNDIGCPSAVLLGQEIRPHDSVGDQIDLLAFDQNDSSLIVIELKRDKHKLQLLQSLAYAAMVATWNSEKLISIVSEKNSMSSEAKELIEDVEFSKQVRIVLIAEYYDPEVIITADWLVSRYGLDIAVFSVELNKVKDDLFLDIDQKYPLPELSEAYKARRRESTNNSTMKSVSWEDVLPKLKYDFAAEGIELCKKIRGEGDPKRRRFGDMLKNTAGFNWVSFNFREKYLNVYTGCDDKAAAVDLISKTLGNHIEVTEWRDGVSFNISKNEDFQKLRSWLKI